MNCSEYTSEWIDDNMVDVSLCGNIKCSKCSVVTYLNNIKCIFSDPSCKTFYSSRDFKCSSC